MTLISVRPADLRAAGAAVHDAAAIIAESIRGLADEFTLEPRGGWSTLREMRRASDFWSAYLRRLRDDVDAAAGALAAAADSYSAAEWEADRAQRGPDGHGP